VLDESLLIRSEMTMVSVRTCWDGGIGPDDGAYIVLGQTDLPV
jgi:hypothetical protein